MSNPNRKSKVTLKDDDSQYVSPTSDDTVAERFKKVRAREAEMTGSELLAALRTNSSLFDDESETKVQDKE